MRDDLSYNALLDMVHGLGVPRVGEVYAEREAFPFKVMNVDARGVYVTVGAFNSSVYDPYVIAWRVWPKLVSDRIVSYVRTEPR